MSSTIELTRISLESSVSHGFPMVFPWVSRMGFQVFPWFSPGFPMGFPPFSGPSPGPGRRTEAWRKTRSAPISCSGSRRSGWSWKHPWRCTMDGRVLGEMMLLLFFFGPWILDSYKLLLYILYIYIYLYMYIHTCNYTYQYMWIIHIWLVYIRCFLL